MRAWKKTEPFKQMKFPKSKNNKSQELYLIAMVNHISLSVASFLSSSYLNPNRQGI